jgi:hypothetical protein
MFRFRWLVATTNLLFALPVHATKAEIQKIVDQMKNEKPGTRREFGGFSAERSVIGIKVRPQARTPRRGTSRRTMEMGANTQSPFTRRPSPRTEKGGPDRMTTKSGVWLTYYQPGTKESGRVSESWLQARSKDGRFQPAFRTSTFRSSGMVGR